MYEVLNRTQKNPIVNFYIGLSPPCGNRRHDYMKRSSTLDKIYKEGDSCRFEMNGTAIHPEYYETGLYYPELKVLSDNKLLD